MPLSDSRGREISYLRLSITDRCNYRCTYCMPAAGFPRVGRDEVLSLEELARIARLFASLGVRAVRITGGEPTVRGGLPELVRMVADTEGIEDVALTTNGERLGELSEPLRRAGLRRINVSLDTLDALAHQRLTRGGVLGHVLEGLEAARSVGFDAVKLNTVVIRDVNDREVETLCRFAWERGLVPRFIELMPLGEAGRMHGPSAVLPTRELLTRLSHLLEPDVGRSAAPGLGPAVYYRRRGGDGEVAGFIGAVTESFCATCNRVRVTARGELRGCLARPEGVSLREPMRAGASDEALVALIREAVLGRREGHDFGEQGDGDRSGLVVMTGVGG